MHIRRVRFRALLEMTRRKIAHAVVGASRILMAQVFVVEILSMSYNPHATTAVTLSGLRQKHGVLVPDSRLGFFVSLTSLGSHGTIIFQGRLKLHGRKGRPVHCSANILRERAVGIIVIIFEDNITIVIHCDALSVVLLCPKVSSNVRAEFYATFLMSCDDFCYWFVYKQKCFLLQLPCSVGR